MSGDGILRIVVGVDFTETGDRALDAAFKLTIPLEIDELHPVYVISKPDTKHLDELEHILEEARGRLREHLLWRGNLMGQRWDQPVVFHVRIGNPATELHQVAVDVGADLIVVGTHERQGVAKMLLGSVAEELVRTARAPVLVARANDLAKLPKSEQPDPAEPGVDLHRKRTTSSEHVQFGKRSSHVSGLL